MEKKILTDQDRKFLAQQKRAVPKMYLICAICLIVTFVILMKIGLTSGNSLVKGMAFSGSYFCAIATTFVYSMRKKDIAYFKIIDKLSS